ncbi:zonadhesin isoform X1 [Dendroctonus ponderosae]|uniref:TIL domain-containing protein n=1 Tax=Dendroctonus ponderosae TaxID=77166 RepID=U4U6R6_DENPD|nr:zonadhesin isoform X1 [Dendroctonus ponderosae]ERL85645.1 hypothetical protein D910_03062 [Dendroctonus ponderosae]KAH1015020.1 hypothetical protein HUJ05_012803 [Dendroctonus ponderosae]
MSIIVLFPILLFIAAGNAQATNSINTTVTPVERCGPNQYWNNCPDGCAPKPTCDNLNYTQPGGAICHEPICRPNCTCIKGYVWFKGECIRRTQCPNYDPELNSCGIGGFEDNCATACQLVERCVPEILGIGPVIICTPRCIKECRCYPGYVLFEGRCITWSDCYRKFRPTHFHTTTVETTEVA